MSIEIDRIVDGERRNYQFTVTRQVVSMAIEAYNKGNRSHTVCLIIDMLTSC